MRKKSKYSQVCPSTFSLKMNSWIEVDHSFSTFTKFYEKRATCAYQGVRNVSFSENFTNVLNQWSREESRITKDNFQPSKYFYQNMNLETAGWSVG